MRHIAILSAAICLAAACTPSTEAPSELAITVKPLTLAGITDARYRVRVEDRDRALVFEREITSATHGDGAGAIAYVGPCDPAKNPNYVTVELLSLTDADGPLAANDWAAPPPIEKPATCVANADAPVSFELTLARSGEQGFFDVAVALDDVFCSAKLDCGPSEDEDLLLLHDGDQRATTAVLGFACAAGPDASDTRLYLDHVKVDCEDGTHAVVPVDQLGNVDLAVPPGDDGDGYLFGAGIYRASEGPITFWNVSLGLDRDRFATAGRCTLSALATASNGAFPGEAEAVLTPAGAVYPVIEWNVVLSDDGVKVCREHPLDGEPPGVVTRYITEPHRFGQAYGPGSGLVYGLPGFELVTDEPSGEVGAGQGGSLLIALDDGGVAQPVPIGSGVVRVEIDNPGCVSAPSFVTLPAGATSVSVPFTAGPSPCTTIIRIAHPVYGDGQTPVTVVAAPDLGPLSIAETVPTGNRVGEALGASYVVSRQSPLGTQSVEVESLDPQRALLATSPTGPASPKVRLSFAYLSAHFYVRGIDGAAGADVRLVARHPRHTDGEATVHVVPLALAVQGLAEDRSIHDAQSLGADRFQVAAGVIADDGDFVRQYATRELPLDLTLSGDPIGLLKSGSVIAAVLHPTIVFGEQATPMYGTGSVMAVFDDPPELGEVIVTAALSADHVTRATATSRITTLPNSLALVDASGEYAVGLGLERSLQLQLNGSHDATDVVITSSDPERILLSSSRTTPGTATLVVPVAAAELGKTIYVQTTPDTLGDFELLAQAPQFADGAVTLAVVEPSLDVLDVAQVMSGNTLSLASFGDQGYRVATGIAGATGFVRQYVSPANGPLTIDVATDHPALMGPVPAQVVVAVGEDYSPYNAAVMRMYAPLYAALVTTSATADGFVAGTATTNVDIDEVTVALRAVPGDQDDGRVAGGLAREMWLRLSHTTPTAMTFTLTSSDPSKVRLATGNTTASGSLTIDLAAGTSSIPVWLHGTLGQTGDVDIAVAVHGQTPVADASRTISLVKPRANLIGVASGGSASPTSPAQPDYFQIEVGYTLTTGTLMRLPVSAASGPLSIPINVSGDGLLVPSTSSYALAVGAQYSPLSALSLLFSATSGTHDYLVSVGNSDFETSNAVAAQWRYLDLVLNINTSITTLDNVNARGIGVVIQSAAGAAVVGNGATVTLTSSSGSVGVGTSISGPFGSSASLVYSASQSARTFYVKGLAGGSATLSATISNGGADPASKTFSVDTSGSTLTWTDSKNLFRIPAGMQTSYTINFGASINLSGGPKTITLSSNEPSRVYFSSVPGSAGTSTYTSNAFSGQTGFTIYVQTSPGDTRDVELYIAIPGYTTGARTITIEAGTLLIDHLTTSQSGNAWGNWSDEAFYVYAGIPNASEPLGVTTMRASPYLSSVSVTCDSSNPARGYPFSNNAGANTAGFAAPNTNTPTTLATGGFVNRMVGTTSGSYVITCSAPGFVSTSKTVTLSVSNVTQTIAIASGGANDMKVGRGLMRQITMTFSSSPGAATTFYIAPRGASRIALTELNSDTVAAAPLSLAYSAGTSARSFYMHGAGELGDVTFDVWCNAPCKYPSTTFTAYNVIPRVDFANLEPNSTQASIDTLTPDTFSFDVGITSGGAMTTLSASRVFGGVSIPMWPMGSQWSVQNGTFDGTRWSVVMPAGQSSVTTSGGYAMVLTNPNAGSNSVDARGINDNVTWDSAGVYDSRTVTVKQIKLEWAATPTTITRSTNGTQITLSLKYTDGTAYSKTGTVRISATNGVFVNTNTINYSWSSTLDIPFSGSSTIFRFSGYNLPTGAVTTTIGASWVGLSTSEITPASSNRSVP